MTDKIPPACLACTHHNAAAPYSCTAYPEHIPPEILSGKSSHCTPHPGDHGIRFKRNRNHPAYFVADDPPEEYLFRITTDGICEIYVPVMDTWEEDDEFIRCLIESGLIFRETGAHEADAFVESARMKKTAVNPCSLQFRQMMYLRTRNDRTR